MLLLATIKPATGAPQRQGRGRNDFDRVKQVKLSVRSKEYYCINSFYFIISIITFIASTHVFSHQGSWRIPRPKSPAQLIQWFVTWADGHGWNLDARNIGFLLWELWNLKSIGFKIETWKRDMYDFGTAQNFWIDIPVPQGDVFRQLSILNVQDSVLLTCIGALMNKSWNSFQQPTILYSFDLTYDTMP